MKTRRAEKWRKLCVPVSEGSPLGRIWVTITFSEDHLCGAWQKMDKTKITTMTGGISTIFSTLGGRQAGRLPFRPTAWKLSPLCVHRSFQTSFCQRRKNDVVSKASFFPKSLASDNTASVNHASRSQEIDWGSELSTRERTPLQEGVKGV